MILRLAIKEILNKWKWSLIFVINLSFGFIGFTAVLSYQDAIEKSVKANAKQILSADLSISARRAIPEKETIKAEEYLKSQKMNFVRSDVTEFFAMLNFKDRSQLVLVKAIDSNYPLYGEIKLTESTIKSDSKKEIFGAPKIWAYSEIKNILSMNQGDTVKLGDLDLMVADFVTKDSTQTFRLASLAPRIFVDRALILNSKLIQFGSTFTAAFLYKFETEPTGDIQAELLKIIQDPAVQIDTPATASEDSARQLGFLTDFLNLVALIALLLAGLGASYLYQVFSRNKTKDFAIFKILGMTYPKLVQLYLIQVLFLSVLVCIVSYLGSLAFIPFLQWLIKPLVAQTLNVVIPLHVVGFTLALTIIASLVVVWPYLKQINEIPAGLLFKEERTSLFKSSRNLFTFVFAVFAMGLLAFYLTKSWILTSVFLGLIVGLSILFFGMGSVLIWGLDFIKPNAWTLKYAIRSISRRRLTSLVLFTTMGTSVLLLNILPQLKTSLKAEFLTGANDKLPSLFLFDIQDEQVEPLKTLLKESKKELSQLSPMIRSRLISINDIPYERKIDYNSFKTREEERDARFRNRGINLTFREKLSSSETILEGIDLKDYTGEIPGVSIETKYADRMGIKINDVLAFDIQGVEITGKVVNLRSVKWASFQPNFFISFPPGVLEEAPKTYIGIVNGLVDTEIASLLPKVALSLPNVSIIDVRQLIGDILKVSDQMTMSLELMAYLSLLTGLIILASLMITQMQDRKWEINLFKIFGSTNASLRKYLIYEYGILLSIAIFIGTTFSFLVSYLTVKYSFESDFVPSFKDPLLIAFLVLVISIPFIAILANSYLRQRPKDLL